MSRIRSRIPAWRHVERGRRLVGDQYTRIARERHRDHHALLDLLREAELLFRHSIETVIVRRRDGEQSSWSSESEWERANNMFHQVIQEAAGNARLLAMIAELHQSFPRDLTWAALAQSSHLLRENVEQHARVLSAIERHDAEGARRAMREHVLAAGEVVAHRFETGARSTR